MEANTEVYHVRRHPPENGVADPRPRRNVNTLYPGHGRMVAPPAAARQNRRHDGRPEIETVGEIARTCTSPTASSRTGYRRSSTRCRRSCSGRTASTVPAGDLDLAPDWGNGPEARAWTAEQRRAFDQSAARGHRVRRLDPEIGRVVRIPRRAALVPGSAHLSLESDADADRHRQHRSELRVAQVIGADWLYPRDTERRFQSGL